MSAWCFYCERCDLHMRLADDIDDARAEELKARIESGRSSYAHEVDGESHTLQVQQHNGLLH